MRRPGTPCGASYAAPMHAAPQAPAPAPAPVAPQAPAAPQAAYAPATRAAFYPSFYSGPTSSCAGGSCYRR